MQTYNEYAAFKAQWRRKCADYGIDPETGPTSFQVALVKADQINARRRRESGWWPGERWVWEDWPRAAVGRETFRQVIHAPVEAHLTDPENVSMMELSELWREVKRELAKELPLREWHRLPTVAELRSATLDVLMTP